MSDSITSYPKLLALFDPYKNGSLNPESLLIGSGLKVYWTCKNNHTWLNVVRQQAKKIEKTSRTGCDYCDNKKFLKHFNDITITHPEIAKLWDENKNIIPVTNIFYTASQNEYWWVCDKGHQYESTVLKKIRHIACPICYNKQLLPNVNDTETSYPHLTKEWNTEANPKKLNQTLPNDPSKYWWVCDKGHNWEATIQSKLKNKTSCPICSHRILQQGANDLATTNPELANEWHPTKNGGLTPEQVFSGSGKKVWWKCAVGHEWETTPNVRSYQKTGCPVCAGRQTAPTFNDLLHIRPDIASEWDYTLNKNRTPTEFTIQSSYQAWWICDKGHQWKAAIYNRTGKNNTGCKICSTGNTSNPEHNIQKILINNNINVIINTKKVLPSGKELDLYLPDYNIAIEYNGIYWHSENRGKDRKYHYNKWFECEKQGIQLIQIWEDDWLKNPELIINMLLHKIGRSLLPKTPARKTAVTELTKKTAQTFLNKNHIQGWVAGSLYFGLQNNETQETIAVMVINRNKNNTYTISRYATSEIVAGGFTKILNHIEKKFTPSEFVTFSDNTVSNGRLYEKNGFIADKEIRPDYMYVVKGERKHKFGYRIKRFKNDPNLKYAEGLTESQLAQLNNIPRIWDAGKTRWIKQINNPID